MSGSAAWSAGASPNLAFAGYSDRLLGTARCLRAVLLVVCAGTGMTAVPGVSAQETNRFSWTPDPYGLAGAASSPSGIALTGERDPDAWKAALLSLVVPGSGQIWSGRKWGWGLVAAEAVFIGGGVWARSEGGNRRDDYERFADQHWDRDRYMEYLDSYETATGSPWPYDHHTLPAEGVRNHDYYEMIGKYEQFAPGWDDWNAWYDLPYRGDSVRRGSYLNKRQEANRYLKLALTAGGLVFLNHAAASAEALIWGLRGGGGSQWRHAGAASPWSSALHSLLLPGWGQRLQGRRGLANALVITEAVFWSGLVGFKKYSGWKLEDSRQWAAIHAGVNSYGKDDAYFRSLAFYPDLTTYNAAQRSGLGDPSTAYPQGSGYEWRWDSEPAWKHYRELRRDSRLASNIATLALGGIVAGRLVGAVTALIYGKRSGSAATGSRHEGGPLKGNGSLLRLVPMVTSYPGGVAGLQLVAAIH